MAIGYPPRVKVYEVGARDGLQNEARPIPAADKVRFINMLTEAGLPFVEATSCVSPKWVPQLADGPDVYAAISKKEGTRYPVLVPNVKGMETALRMHARDIAVFTAASDAFNKRNVNKTYSEQRLDLKEVCNISARESVLVRAYVSTSFFCPITKGRVSEEDVYSVVSDLIEFGAYEVAVSDTVGLAVPTDVERLFEFLVRKNIPLDKLAVHYHDTRGTAVANILKSLEIGVTAVDSSAGGLGGCPYAPGASGNVATEDVVFLLNGMGVQTGVDLDKVVQASRFMESVLGKTLPSKYLQSCKA